MLFTFVANILRCFLPSKSLYGDEDMTFVFIYSHTMANLEQWVSDQLHDILGLSDRYVAQYMIGLVQKSSGPEDFVTRLQQTGTIDIDQRITAFAHELYNKVDFFWGS